MIIIGLFLLAYYIQFYFYLWILALINMCNLYIMCHCAYMLKKENTEYILNMQASSERDYEV